MDIKLIPVRTIAILLLTGLCACSPGSPAPGEMPEDFNFIFKYGVGARNELNTFDGTFTKDLIAIAPVTTALAFSEEEMERVYRKMRESGFFEYPDEFAISVESGVTMMVTPYYSYYFRVFHGGVEKELRWEDRIKNENADADRLRDLIDLIIDIIESKKEYKELPPPTGGYM